MPDKNNDIMPNSGFKADNFDKEKEAAKKIEEQNKSKANTTSKEQEILKQQKETD